MSATLAMTSVMRTVGGIVYILVLRSYPLLDYPRPLCARSPFITSPSSILGFPSLKPALFCSFLYEGVWEIAIRVNFELFQWYIYVKARLSVAALRVTHLCLRGSRVPTQNISNRFSQWEDGAGLSMHEWI